MKEKNILDNNKLYNNSNILFNSNNKHPVNILDSKILNDNPKILGNNIKNTFIKNKKLDIEKINETNLGDFNTNIISKKIGLVNIPIKKTKYTLLNSTHGHGKLNDKRNNNFLFSDSRDMIFAKLFNNSKKLRNFQNNSIDLKFKKISYSQNNTKENKANNNKEINSRNISKNNKLITNKDFKSVKETVNKSNEEIFPSINNIEKKFKKINLNTNSLNFSSKNDAFISDNNNRNNEKKKLNSLSGKEKAFYILSQSKVLRLCERIIFSRTTPKIRSLISINDILKSNEIFIKNKIKELEQKIITYNNKMEMAFSPTRTATISLNLILKDDEDDFKKLNFKDDNLDESEKKYYNIYLQLLNILLNEEFNEKNLENNDINIVYDKLREKGFLSLKDYLYDIFIKKKFKKGSINEKKEKTFIELFEKLPDLIRYEGDIKNNRFISFSYFILYEMNNYLKKNKELAQIKDKIQYYIDCLKKKISNININIIKK